MQAILAILVVFVAFMAAVTMPSKISIIDKDKVNEIIRKDIGLDDKSIKQIEDFQKDFNERSKQPLDASGGVSNPSQSVKKTETPAAGNAPEQKTQGVTLAQNSGQTTQGQTSTQNLVQQPAEVPTSQNQMQQTQAQNQTQPTTQIVSDPTNAEIIDLVNSYKPVFAANKEKLPPDGESTYVLRLGSGKVLITASHAVNHIREGSIKIVDYCTGPITKALSDLTGAHLLYLNYYSRDPNYYDDMPFKDALSGFVQSNGVKLVIDIHGASDDHGWDVDLGDINGASLLSFKDLASVATGFFNQYGIGNVSRNDFAGGEGQNTVTKFVSSKLKVDAMQFELARKYRCETDEKTAAIVKALKRIVDKYK